ncbi:MAG: helix-turn-helix transcriptional regulator, partial [Lachnospiraceae bacterium]|nr:helix-turn-helix transcriptional regulator [Lachnospiraceae bacterium]
ELVTKVTDCAWECLNSESITSYIHINMSPYCLVVCMNGQMDSFSYGNLVDIIRSLHEQMQKRFGIEINVGIGNIMSNLLDYPKNVTQAVSAALTCLSNPDTYFTEYGSGESEALPEEASAFISRLSVSIKQNNVKEVAASFSFLDERKAGHKQTRVQENYMAYSVALMLLEYAKEAGEGERLDKVFSLLSSGRGNIDEIYGLIRDIAVDITTAREEKSRRDREERSQAHELLIKIKKVIDERLCDSMLSLDVLAEECGVSPSYLSRYFKQRMDCTPMAYVENARMDIAKNYLVTTELSLDEILEKSGYIDKSNFIRKFKKREGMTPMSYRKAMSDAE